MQKSYYKRTFYKLPVVLYRDATIINVTRDTATIKQ